MTVLRIEIQRYEGRGVIALAVEEPRTAEAREGSRSRQPPFRWRRLRVRTLPQQVIAVESCSVADKDGGLADAAEQLVSGSEKLAAVSDRLSSLNPVEGGVDVVLLGIQHRTDESRRIQQVRG